MKLLGFLRRTHGKAEKPAEDAPRRSRSPSTRRKVEELTVAAPARAKTTVDVEVRQKRTYVKRDGRQRAGNDERDDALRKLEESKSRNAAEQAAPERDRPQARPTSASATPRKPHAWREEAATAEAANDAEAKPRLPRLPRPPR